MNNKILRDIPESVGASPESRVRDLAKFLFDIEGQASIRDGVCMVTNAHGGCVLFPTSERDGCAMERARQTRDQYTRDNLVSEVRISSGYVGFSYTLRKA